MNKPSQSRQEVCGQIRRAFAGVRLEDGIGLSEARGIDDHADEKTLEACRQRDEKQDWAAISHESLAQYSDTMCFFDSKGMRFHLPAFMIDGLTTERNFTVIFCLTHLSAWSMTKFADLTPAQRSAVRAFLLLLKDDDACTFEKPQIEAALANYWTE